MLQYDPKNLKYPGDEKFRVYTQFRQSKRKKQKRKKVTDDDSVNSDFTSRSGITKADLEEHQHRLCGFLDSLVKHEQWVQSLPKNRSKICVSCGKPCHHQCMACPGEPAIHFYRPNGRANSCFVHYHNTGSFGRWKCDSHLVGSKRKEWTYPTEQELSENSLDMKRLQLAQERPVAAPAPPPLSTNQAPNPAYMI